MKIKSQIIQKEFSRGPSTEVANTDFSDPLLFLVVGFEEPRQEPGHLGKPGVRTCRYAVVGIWELQCSQGKRLYTIVS